MPTFADVAGANISKNDGISLLPALLGEQQSAHDYLYWEFHENKTTDQAIRQGNWNAVRHDPQGEIELYDLSQDIGEQNDVAGQRPEVVQKMAALFATARTDHPLWSLKSSSGTE